MQTGTGNMVIFVPYNLFGGTALWLPWHGMLLVWLQRSECGAWVPVRSLVGSLLTQILGFGGFIMVQPPWCDVEIAFTEIRCEVTLMFYLEVSNKDHHWHIFSVQKTHFCSRHVK